MRGVKRNDRQSFMELSQGLGLASGAVYCNRSCLYVCVFATGGWVGGRVLSEPYYSQHAHSVCVSVSAFFIN